MPPGTLIKYNNTMAFATLNHIYFKYVDLYAGECYLRKNKEQPKSFRLVLSHELIHVWQEKQYGFFKFLMMNEWVKEGYAMYATEDNLTQGIEYLLDRDFEELDGKEWYVLWGLMVKHAIEKMHKSVDDLHLGKVDYEEVLDSLLREYNITKR